MGQCVATPVTQMGGMYAPYYSLSKAAMNRATQLLAEDKALTSRGITIAAVTPGWCRVCPGLLASFLVSCATQPVHYCALFAPLCIICAPA